MHHREGRGPLRRQNQRAHQHAHEVGAPAAQPDREEADDRRRREGGHAHVPGEQERQDDKQPERPETEPGVVQPSDRGQVSIAHDEDQHEPRGRGDGDPRQQEGEVQWRVRRLEGHQDARSRGAKRDEREQGEDRVR